MVRRNCGHLVFIEEMPHNVFNRHATTRWYPPLIYMSMALLAPNAGHMPFERQHLKS